MSITTAQLSGVNNGQRDIPVVYSLPQNRAITAYVRPSDWLTLPTVLPTDQKVVLLVAVTNDNSNYFALTARTSAGTYTVDWGDGTAPTTHATNTIAQRNLDYNAYNPSTLSTRGYRQAIITITPTTANLTEFNLNTRFADTTLNLKTAYMVKVLDAVIAGSNINLISFGGTGQQYCGLMEQVNILSCASNINFSDCFRTCKNLVNIVNIPNTNCTTFVRMFQGCDSLQTVPLFNTSNGTNFDSMFLTCYNLRNVPNFDTSSATNMSNMFNTCVSLMTAPLMNTINVTNMSAMFNECWSLSSVPPYDTRNVTNMDNMFPNCRGLKTVPLFNTVKVTTAANMFLACQSLITVPAFNWIALTNAQGLFDGCTSLETVPPMNMPVVQFLNAAFRGCIALKNVGTITTGTALTQMPNIFENCRSLISAPIITDTSRVTTTLSAFSECYSLTNLPTYDTSNVTTMNRMFFNCRSLQELPNFNTAKVTDMGAMLNQTAIVTIPTWNTINVSNMQTMFNACYSLSNIPLINTSNVLNMSGIFQSTWSLDTVPNLNTSNVTNFSSFCFSSGVRNIDANFNLDKVTNFGGSVFNNCLNLAALPLLNLPNATSAGDAFSSGALSNVITTNLKVTTSIASSQFSKINIENFMSNLGSNNTSQTLTLGSNPGSDTANSKTSTWNTASNVVTMSNTVGTVIGCQLTAATNFHTGFSFTATSNKVSVNSLIDDNTLISFSTVTTSNLTANRYYYVSNRSGAGPWEYSLSTTSGGNTITFTNGTMVGRVNILVTAVNTNANVVLNAYPAGNGTSGTLTSRLLNTNLAAFKGWTISG